MYRESRSPTTTPPGAGTTAWHTRHEPRATRVAGLANHVGRAGRAGRAGRVARELGAGALGLGVAATTLTLLATVARRGMAASGGAPRPEDALLVLLAWVGVLLSAWLALGSLLAVAALLPGVAGRVAAEVADRVTPVALRRAVALVLGASVGSMALPAAPVSGAGTPHLPRGAGGRAALAEPVPHLDLVPGYTPTETTPGYAPTDTTPGYAPTVDAAAGSAPTGVSLPDLPDHAGQRNAPAREPARQEVVTPGPPRSPQEPGYLPTQPTPVHDAERSRLMVPTPRPATSVHEHVTVRRGDSLWAIAARHLGPGASDAQVAREWPRWYAANRDVVGADPDLLLPGLQLRPPSGTSSPGARVSRTTGTPSSDTHPGTDRSAPAEHGARP